MLVTRGLVLVPIFLLGFHTGALHAYLVFVSFHAVFIHAVVRVRFGWIDRVIATPRGHHWHHAPSPVDKNLAVHLPVLDRIFGTQHLPGDAWPAAYGIDSDPVPEGYLRQLRIRSGLGAQRGTPSRTRRDPARRSCHHLVTDMTSGPHTLSLRRLIEKFWSDP